MNSKIKLFLLFIGLAFFNSSFSGAQDHESTTDHKKFNHNESVDGKYLPNEYNNNKLSPAYKMRKRAEQNTVQSGIFTNQANVNPGGQNIIGDAANETTIAVNPLNPNMIVIGWRQFDNVLSNFRQAGFAYSTDAGQTWTFPGVIEPGIFRSDPVLNFDSSGTFFYNSLSKDSLQNYFCKVFKSNNGGALWDVGTDAEGGDKQWMTIDRTAGAGHGNIYSFWSSSYSICQPDYFTRSTNGGSSYENCTYPDGDPFWGTMAVGNAGELYICGAQKDSITDLVVLKSNNAKIPGSIITWEAPVSVFMDGDLGGAAINPDGLLGQANIAVDRSGGAGHANVYLLASVWRLSNPDPGDVMFARSVDGGLTWSSPIRINDDTSVTNTQWFGTMSVAPNGRIDAVWLDNRDGMGSDSSALYYSYSLDQGTTWSLNEKLSDLFDPHVGYPDQNKMGDYFDMISVDAGAHLAWANTLNGEQDVYYSFITPPNTVGIQETSSVLDYSIFPNPNKGIFVIKGAIKPTQVEIYNLVGEHLQTEIISRTQSEIDISALASGVYFLKIIGEDRSVVSKKVIVE